MAADEPSVLRRAPKRGWPDRLKIRKGPSHLSIGRYKGSICHRAKSQLAE